MRGVLSVKRGPEAEGFDVKRDVLFVGMGTSAVAYYRCFLPALALGCDWVGVHGEPPETHWATGLVGKDSVMPDMLRDYKIVVVQQPAGKGWNEAIETMRDAGVKVVYEIDDYIHGIKNMKDHDFREHFDKEHLWNVEQAMKRCDALIASTEWIRSNYRHFNKRTYLCENGLDLARYDLTIPDRPTTNIGWAGATGHLKAITPWLQQVAGIMRIRPQTAFVSIGQPFGEAMSQHFGDRAIAVPFAAIEQYPAAMTMIDVALAPGGNGSWWRGKSDLRWLEAGALGIPIIANPNIYPKIEDGVTGFHAASPQEMVEKLVMLVDDEKLRRKVGANAQEYVRNERDVKKTASQWITVFEDLLGDS